MIRSGSELVLEVLQTEGVSYVFGNPGTTELALVNTIGMQADIKYVLGLQEATVVGMADGYARATNKPAFVNLHATAGLGNGLGAVSNAAYMNTPMVITAGQQDFRHLADEPWLSGDLVGLARPLCKWAHEVRTAGELGIMLRRAFKEANSYPKGPVFVSLPQNFMEQQTDAMVPEKSIVYQQSVAAGLEQLCDVLDCLQENQLAIVAGDEISAADALAEVIDLAELLGADVYGSALHDSVVFPTSHPLWRGALKPASDEIQKTLEPYKKVLAIGERCFMSYLYTPESPLPKHLDLLHLSANPKALAMTFGVKWSSVGDVRSSLHALNALLRQSGRKPANNKIEICRKANAEKVQQCHRELRGDMDAVPIPPESAAYVFLESIAEDAIIVDEAPATMWTVRQHFQTSGSGQYHFSKGGGLGWAMPAAVGIAIERRDQSVYCLIGDGAAMYSPQALWNAANLKLDITFVVFNNSEYGVLKNYLRAVQTNPATKDNFIGMDINSPAIDFQFLASSMDVAFEKVEKARDIEAVIARMQSIQGPRLVEIVIAPLISNNISKQ